MLIALLGLAASAAGFLVVRELENQAIHSQFVERGERVAGALETAIRSDVDFLHDLRRLYAASEQVTPEEFRQFARRAVLDDPSLLFVAWAASESPEGERGAAFRMRYVEPREAGRRVADWDLAAHPATRRLIEQVRATGKLLATGPIWLGSAGGRGAVILVAAHSRNGAEPGVVLAAVSFRGLLAELRRREKLDGLNVALGGPAEAASGRLDYRRDLIVADARWPFRCTAVPGFVRSQRSWAPWLVGLSGVLVTGVLCAYALTLVCRNQVIKREVAEKTALLRTINDMLETTISCRREEEVGAACLAAAQRLIGCELAFVGELNAAGRLNVTAQTEAFWDACSIAKAVAVKLVQDMEVRGLWAEPIRTGRTIRTNQPRRHPASVGTPEGHPEIRSFLAAPLKRGGRVVGVLALANRPGGFGRREQELAEQLAAAFMQALLAKRSEVALRRKSEELRQAQKLEAVGQLAGGVAHEFNNLLQAISGYTQFAMEGLDPHDQRYQDLQQVCHATERAATLTRQLLSFSRRERMAPGPTDANELVRRMASMLQPLLGEQIELELSLPEPSPTVRADADALEQALLNLCVNARDAMPDGGRLTVSVAEQELTERRGAYGRSAAPGRYVVFRVSDTGCGMSEEVKERIFDPFFTTKEVGKGTGLGLAQVYGVVEQHNGTVEVASAPGRGSTFALYIPAADELAADAAGPSSTPSGGRARPKAEAPPPRADQLADELLHA